MVWYHNVLCGMGTLENIKFGRWALGRQTVYFSLKGGEETRCDRIDWTFVGGSISRGSSHCNSSGAGAYREQHMYCEKNGPEYGAVHTPHATFIWRLGHASLSRRLFTRRVEVWKQHQLFPPRAERSSTACWFQTFVVRICSLQQQCYIRALARAFLDWLHVKNTKKYK